MHGPEQGRPVCRFPTKKACDENFTQYQHGHLGTPCVKQQQPSKSKRGQMNKTETCVLVTRPERGESFAAGLARQRTLVPTPTSGRV